MNYPNLDQMDGKNQGRKAIAEDKRGIPPLRPLKSEVFNDLPIITLRQGTSIYNLVVEDFAGPDD